MYSVTQPLHSILEFLLAPDFLLSYSFIFQRLPRFSCKAKSDFAFHKIARLMETIEWRPCAEAVAPETSPTQYSMLSGESPSGAMHELQTVRKNDLSFHACLFCNPYALYGLLEFRSSILLYSSL